MDISHSPRALIFGKEPRLFGSFPYHTGRAVAGSIINSKFGTLSPRRRLLDRGTQKPGVNE
jgi:hypothetical protein